MPQNGEALIRQRLTVYLTDATFRVFTGDSPIALFAWLCRRRPRTSRPLVGALACDLVGAVHQCLAAGLDQRW